MMQRIGGWLAGVALAAASLGGCLIVQRDDTPTAPGDRYDPRGADATLAFSWRIDGRDPARDPTACAEAGVQFLRLTILDGAGAARNFPSLQWDCNLGRYRSAAPELRAGSYQVYFEAIAADGTRRSVAPARRSAEGRIEPAPEAAQFVAGQLYDFDRGNTVDPTLPGNPTNFATGTGALEVDLQYTRGAAAPTGCEAARVARIRWQLLAPNGVAVENHTTAEACAMYARVRWDTVLLDQYTLAVTALGADGAPLGTGRCGPLLVRRGPSATRHPCTIALPGL